MTQTEMDGVRVQPDPCYRIRNWSLHFENNRTRDLVRMSWVPVPNKHDGDGYTELLDHPNGIAHYGAWCLLIQVASKCDVRGTLLRDGSKAHTPHSLARITRAPAAIFAEAIRRLVTIGWLEVCEIPHEGAASPHDPARNGIEWNGMEGGGREASEAPPDSASPSGSESGSGKRPGKNGQSKSVLDLRDQIEAAKGYLARLQSSEAAKIRNAKEIAAVKKRKAELESQLIHA